VTIRIIPLLISRPRRFRRALRALAPVIALALCARNAIAQGCAMCYQNAAASGDSGRAALRHGILLLLLPAVTLFCGVLALIYHRRNASR
jgi:hypothetical protein